MRQVSWCVNICYLSVKYSYVTGLKPDLNCIRGRSTRDCMDKIRLGDADMIALDAADVFVAGK